MGLISIRDQAKELYDKEHRKYQNHINLHFDESRPNEIWVSDVTYFKIKDKAYYICVVMDLFSRMVVGCIQVLLNAGSFSFISPEREYNVYPVVAFRNCERAKGEQHDCAHKYREKLLHNSFHLSSISGIHRIF